MNCARRSAAVTALLTRLPVLMAGGHKRMPTGGALATSAVKLAVGDGMNGAGRGRSRAYLNGWGQREA